MRIVIPEKVKFILDKLAQNGFSAYVVGGCVRDALLGLSPDDWDITTSALPEQVKSLFEKTVDTGLKHGTVSVLSGGDIFEVTTFRKDGDYKDNRHPESVTFSSALSEDLARRDFTINAMAYNETEGLIDDFCGEEDLKTRSIRCVGDPDTRFKEDSLRILRAVRFSAQKDFEIEKNTLYSIRKNAHLVKNLSVERILSEITKILLANPEKIKTLYETGVLEEIMPELCRSFETEQNIKWHIYDVGTHSIEVAKNLPKKSYLRFAGIMHDWGKPLTKGKNPDGSDHFRNHAKESVRLCENFMTNYKFSNKDKDKILRLIKYHDREIIPEKKYVKRAINAVGEDIFPDLILLKKADCLSQNFELTAPRMKIYEKIESVYEEIISQKEPFSLKNLAVNGKDLIPLGYKGKEIGNTLDFLLNHVIECPNDNEKEILLTLLKNKEQ